MKLDTLSNILSGFTLGCIFATIMVMITTMIVPFEPYDRAVQNHIIEKHGEIYDEMLSITDKIFVLSDYNARNTHYADPNHGTDRPLCPECQNAPLISLETLKADLGDIPLDEVAVTQEQIYDDTVELLMFAKRIDDSLTNITFPTIHTYECLKK